MLQASFIALPMCALPTNSKAFVVVSVVYLRAFLVVRDIRAFVVVLVVYKGACDALEKAHAAPRKAMPPVECDPAIVILQGQKVDRKRWRREA